MKTIFSTHWRGKYKFYRWDSNNDLRKARAWGSRQRGDYLVGEGQLANYDKEVLKRIEDIEKLDNDTKNNLFFLIDNVIQNFKTKQAFAK